MSQALEFKVPTMADMAMQGETPEILFWVGCAGSFDDRYKKVTIAFAKILNRVGIKFAVLGTEESCTGDPARRAGNEFLFQMQATMNIQVLDGYGIKKIVTACPHCFNTFYVNILIPFFGFFKHLCTTSTTAQTFGTTTLHFYQFGIKGF